MNGTIVSHDSPRPIEPQYKLEGPGAPYHSLDVQDMAGAWAQVSTS